MATLTIRNIDDETKEQLRVRAARKGHSMEEEVRMILRQAVHGLTGPELLKVTETLFGKQHGVDLDIPQRQGRLRSPGFAEE